MMETWRYELYHYGVMGMKWGVHRYQKRDQRNSRSNRRTDNNSDTSVKRRSKIKKGAIIAGSLIAAYGAYKLFEYGSTSRRATKAVDKHIAKAGEDYIKRMLSIDKATEQKYGFSTKRTKEDFDAWRNTGREFAARNRKQTIKRLTREAIKTKRYNGKIWIKNNIVSKIDPYTNMFGPSQYMADPIKNYHGV